MSMSWLYFPTVGTRIDIAYSRLDIGASVDEIWVIGRNEGQAVLTLEDPPEYADYTAIVNEVFAGFDADPSGEGYVAIILHIFNAVIEGEDRKCTNLIMQTSGESKIERLDISSPGLDEYVVFSNQTTFRYSVPVGDQLVIRRPDNSFSFVPVGSEFPEELGGILIFPGIKNLDISSPVITEDEVRNLRYSIELDNAIFRKSADIWHIDNTGATTELDISEAELLTTTPTFTDPEYHYRHPILYVIDIPDAYTSGTATIYENTIDLEAGTMVLTDTLSEPYIGRSSYDNYEVLQYVYYPA